MFISNQSLNKSNSHDSEDKHQYNFILINDFDSVKWVLETVVHVVMIVW